MRLGNPARGPLLAALLAWGGCSADDAPSGGIIGDHPRRDLDAQSDPDAADAADDSDLRRDALLDSGNPDAGVDSTTE